MIRQTCPGCGATCLHETCCECGTAFAAPEPDEPPCLKCGKPFNKHSCRFCGCCGEYWEDCKHPDGPTDDYREFLRRGGGEDE